jgi:putative oxidoreductase
MNKFFSASPYALNTGLLIVRVAIGMFLIYHGWEIFNNAKMNEYLTWDAFRYSSAGTFLVYAGKTAELIAGVLLFLGLFTRIAALLVIGALGYIVFNLGNGIIWNNDQHPFLFVLFGVLFLFTGPGTISMDHYLFNRK